MTSNSCDLGLEMKVLYKLYGKTFLMKITQLSQYFQTTSKQTCSRLPLYLPLTLPRPHPSISLTSLTAETEHIEVLVWTEDDKIWAEDDPGCFLQVIVHLAGSVVGTAVSHHTCLVTTLNTKKYDKQGWKRNESKKCNKHGWERNV